MIWIILVVAVAILLWHQFIRPMNYFKRKGVKQTDDVWPVLGNQWKTMFRLKSFSESVQEVYNMYPKERYMGYYQFSQPILMLKDPELIKQLTVKDFDYFTDHRGFVDPDTDPLFGNNLLALKGQKWKEMRSILSGTFTSSKIKQMHEVINEVAQGFVQHFLNKKKNLIEVEMKDAYTRYSNDVIATTAFGIKVNSLENPNNEFYQMGKSILAAGSVLTQVKFLLFFAAPKIFKKLKLSIIPKALTKFFQKIIHKTIKVREENNIVRQDMINLLLEARKEIKHEEIDVTKIESNHLDKYNAKQPKQFSNDYITSQALIFFLAGFETISTALSFGSYELATNKNVQDKLRKEINETHKENNSKVTYESILKMPYLDMVFSEILRKCAPAAVIDRVCTKPYTIEPVNPGEKPIHLKVGDMLWLPFHGLHHDPKFYPNPEKFDPQRFSDENKSSIMPYTYIPFGSGPRSCIGIRFAILEAKTLIYHLLLNFEIVPIKRTQIPLKLAKDTPRYMAEGGFWLGLKRIQQE